MMYKELIERLSNLLQSYTAYTDPDLAHALEEAMIAISTLIAKNTKLANRCAAYEDTGLEPEEIDILKKYHDFNTLEDANASKRLCELAQADRDGRCVVLPVEVGQNVYFVNRAFDGEICTAIVIMAEINLYTPTCPTWLKIEWFSKRTGKHEYHSRSDLMIGKTVFLTREEAEKALQEMREQDE